LITRQDVTAADVREVAARTDDAKVARRLLAIALVLDGNSRETGAAACAMDRQTLCDCVHRFNDQGMDGLTDRSRSGRPPRLSAQRSELER
jgi:transposase